MGKIVESSGQLIGGTPLVALNTYRKQHNLFGNIVAKLEYLNPGGSVKDRIAKNMLEAAEAEGKIAPGATIIEPTSGNTGIGLAMLCAQKGYKAIFVMPESMSIERRKLLAAYGAKIVLTPAAEGMNGAIAQAESLLEETPNSFMPSQFTNPANPAAHIKTTGPEIYADTHGAVDIFVAGVGTGGTVTGVGEYLKSQNKNIQVVAVEPSSSAVLSGEPKGPNKIQGIGAGFIPEVLDKAVIDDIVKVDYEDAIKTARELAKTEGILVGISSGAALAAARILAAKEENKDKMIVVLLPDSGERYLSTELFEEV